MTQEEWTREVEAQWTELTNVFFPMDLIINCLDPQLGDPDSPNRYHDNLEKIKPNTLHGTFYAGLDVGKQMDHSVIAVIQKINGKRRLVYKHQFPLGTPYPDVIGHTAKANQIFNFTNILVDKTGVGDVIVDEIEEIGIRNVNGMFLTDRWKEEIFTYLKLLMEQKKLNILSDDAELIAQINEQQYEYQQPKKSAKTYTPKILAPTTQTRRPTIRLSPRLLRQQRRTTKTLCGQTLTDFHFSTPLNKQLLNTKFHKRKRKESAMSCEYCGKDAVYRCSVCGKLLCMEHLKLRTACPSCMKKTTLEYTVNKVALNEEKEKIRELVQRFWGEQEQLTFDRKFMVAEQPAYTAKLKNNIIGFVSFAEADNAIIIVALGILPQHQGSGVGKSLIGKVEAEAKNMRKKRLLVSTSNDDLPALAFYQSLGFQIYEVKPNIIAEKHGRILEGIGGLPIRDELRLRKTLY